MEGGKERKREAVKAHVGEHQQPPGARGFGQHERFPTQCHHPLPRSRPRSRLRASHTQQGRFRNIWGGVNSLMLNTGCRGCPQATSLLAPALKRAAGSAGNFSARSRDPNFWESPTAEPWCHQRNAFPWYGTAEQAFGDRVVFSAHEQPY